MEVEEELHYEGEFPAGQDGTEAQMQSAAPADAEGMSSPRAHSLLLLCMHRWMIRIDVLAHWLVHTLLCSHRN